MPNYNRLHILRVNGILLFSPNILSHSTLPSLTVPTSLFSSDVGFPTEMALPRSTKGFDDGIITGGRLLRRIVKSFDFYTDGSPIWKDCGETLGLWAYIIIF